MQLHIANATIHITLPADNDAQFSTLRVSLEDATQANAKAALSPPAHGDYWLGQGGRYICTLPALLGLPERHLIAGDGEAEDLTFGPYADVSGAASHADGAGNTKALLAHGDHPAAKWAAAYSADGHTDFHLPSRLEMVLAYICAPQLFKKSGWYWTSTQDARDGAFVQDFEGGLSDWLSKDNEHRVRAFRWI